MGVRAKQPQDQDRNADDPRQKRDHAPIACPKVGVIDQAVSIALLYRCEDERLGSTDVLRIVLDNDSGAAGFEVLEVGDCDLQGAPHD